MAISTNLIKEISGNNTVLLILPSAEYNKAIVKLMKELSSKNVCYIALNKTFDSLKELLTKNKVDLSKVVFVDAISSSIKKVGTQADGVYFISSPGALTELSLVISKFLRHKFDYLVFDSITNLSTYNEKKTVERFVGSLINKIPESKVKGIFLALDIKEQEDLIKKAGTFASKVINL